MNTVTATAHDDENNPATDEDDATVTFDDLPSTITVTKTRARARCRSGRERSPSRWSSGTTRPSTRCSSRASDDKFGDLNGKGSCDTSPGEDGRVSISRPARRYSARSWATSRGLVERTRHQRRDRLRHGRRRSAGVGQRRRDRDVHATPPPPYLPKSDIAVPKTATPQVHPPVGRWHGADHLHPRRSGTTDRIRRRT